MVDGVEVWGLLGASGLGPSKAKPQTLSRFSLSLLSRPPPPPPGPTLPRRTRTRRRAGTTCSSLVSQMGGQGGLSGGEGEAQRRGNPMRGRGARFFFFAPSPSLRRRLDCPANPTHCPRGTTPGVGVLSYSTPGASKRGSLAVDPPATGFTLKRGESPTTSSLPSLFPPPFLSTSRPSPPLSPLPGPVNIHENVMRAMDRPSQNHRDPWFAPFFQKVLEDSKVHKGRKS
jgi:hypothetical protein